MKLVLSLAIVLFFKFDLYSQANIPKNYELVYSQDFELPQVLNSLEMSDTSAWRISQAENSKFLELFKQSEYTPEVRSPFNIAIIKNIKVADFIMEIRLNQNGREYGHRDLCVMFGINNASNFYYTHIASKSDEHANSIFIVNDEPRKNIASKRTNGTNWGETNSWHTVRIVRRVDNGLIEIYFDDMSTPIMTATDMHFKSGYLGFGSFDDTGKFDDIKIWAPSLIEEKRGLFK